MARQVDRLWREINQQVHQGKKQALKAGTRVLYTATLEELAAGSPGRGRKYKITKDVKGRPLSRHRYHRASVAGSAPARNYGILQRAIGFKIQQDTAAVGVKNTAPYAIYLDPPRGSPEPRIGRRPFLSSAFEKNKDKAQKAITEEIEKALRRIGGAR